VVLPPSEVIEPVWSDIFDGASAESKRAAATASALWQKLAPTLVRSAGLVGEQQESLVDFCVTWARIEQGERAISRTGMVVATEHGNVRNPWSTVLNQYRANLRSLLGELGLSPLAATRLRCPDRPSDDDPFD